MQRIGRRGRRDPKASASRRAGRVSSPSEGVGKPRRCTASPSASLLPDGLLTRSPWVII